MEKRRARLLALSIGIIAFVIVLDQWLKCVIKTTFSLYEKVEIAPWFQLCFTENSGMAFGMDFIGTVFLCLFRICAIGAFGWFLWRSIKRAQPVGFIICIAMIVAGATGNIIDNCFYGLIFSASEPWSTPAHFVPFGEGYGEFLSGKVVDMFYFPLFTIHFPEWMPLVGGTEHLFFNAIFNLADASISCGAIALLLFFRKNIQTQKPSGDKPDERLTDAKS